MANIFILAKGLGMGAGFEVVVAESRVTYRTRVNTDSTYRTRVNTDPVQKIRVRARN